MAEPNIDITIRKAGSEDAEFLAWLMLTAGRAHVKRGIWEVILNLPEDECLGFLKLLAVTDTPHLFHYSCYLIAETEGKAVAGLGGYDPNSLGYPALQQSLPEVFRKAGKSPPEEMRSGRVPKITTCIPPALEGAWIIDSVATRTDFRRRGIANRLLDSILAIGRSKGFQLAQISIYIGNIPALHAYEKHGFRLLDEWRDDYFEREIGSPGMARLVCTL
jgi:ribosomal protein S18 acetylase RimI-like enzyme